MKQITMEKQNDMREHEHRIRSLDEPGTARANCFKCVERGEPRDDTKQRLYITTIPGGVIVWYCHNCGWKGKLYTHAKEEPNIKEPGNKTKGIVGRLPSDYSKEMPREGIAWLLKYGLTPGEINQYEFGYSNFLNRLIIPIWDMVDDAVDAKIITWQGRNLGKVTKTNPKYISARGVKHDGGLLYNTPTVCIVEDFISTIKVSRVCSALCLCGSHISDRMIKRLESFEEIYIWLDMDKAKTSIQISIKITAALGIPCKSIITTLDPKEYSTDELKKRT